MSLGVLCAAGLISSLAFFANAGAGAAIAIISFMDDHGHIAARWRLMGHFATAAWLLGWMGGLPPKLRGRHAYQFASRRFVSHLQVTVAVGAINLLWLLPIALGVTPFGLNSSLGIILAYAPLVVVAIKFRAWELEKPLMKD